MWPFCSRAGSPRSIAWSKSARTIIRTIRSKLFIIGSRAVAGGMDERWRRPHELSSRNEHFRCSANQADQRLIFEQHGFSCITHHSLRLLSQVTPYSLRVHAPRNADRKERFWRSTAKWLGAGVRRRMDWGDWPDEFLWPAANRAHR